MSKEKVNRVIVDTNIWISFLIGKKLKSLKQHIVSKKVRLITTDQLLLEIKLVTQRPHLRKYFPKDKVETLIKLLQIIAENNKLKKIPSICRDPKDDFLLELAKASKADYLITGDKDLLVLRRYGKTEIISAKEFDDKVSG